MASRTTTKTKSAKDLAREAFEHLLRRDIESVEPYWAEDAVDDFVAIGEVRGRRAIADFFRSTFAAFPDFELQVQRIVGDGDVAVVQWHARGTFTGGPFLGIEPTGRSVSIRGVDVMEWREGQLVHNTIYYDGADFARQIGMLPRRDSTADRAVTAAFNALSKLRTRARRRTA
jgi:steroid delta-isomerase-like uncharacterized protein